METGRERHRDPEPAAVRTLPVVAVPPPLPGGVIRRPRLERLLDDGASRRLTTIVADAGFGKSTLLAAWSQGRTVAWHTVTAQDRDPATLAVGIARAIALREPAVARSLGTLPDPGRGPQAAADEGRRAEALAGTVCQILERALTDDLVLVLDDVEAIGRREAGTRLIAALCRQAPARLHLILSSRVDQPFPIERLRVQGRVQSLGGADLAFTPAETAEFLGAMLEGNLDAIADRLHGATAGWPAAIRLAAEALARVDPETRPSVLDRLLRTSDPVVEHFVEQVVARESPAVRRLMGAMAAFDRFTAPMAEALGFDGAGEMLEPLARRGLFLQAVGAGDWFAIHPVVRGFVLARFAPRGAAMASLRRAAVRWALGAREDELALAVAGEAKEPALIRRVLATRGPSLLAAGHTEMVIDAAAGLKGAARPPFVDRLEGEARQVRGDWDGALTLFRRFEGGGAPMSAGIAWRMGLIHHLRGELDEALRVYGRAGPGPDEPSDEALLRAWHAAALWLRGDTDGVRRLVAEALPIATAAGDHRALAVTHTVLAMLAALDGDRRANDVHYLRALDHAKLGGDVLTQIRIRANRGSRFIEEGGYLAAIDELDEAIGLAEVTGFATFQALALSNRGEALWRLGRFEDARDDLEQARDLYQRLESRMVAYPLGHLGDVYRDRGDRAMARAHYEEALSTAEPSGDLQGLVPALAGLARVLVDEQPERATTLAARAVAQGPALGRVAALLAQGWVALQLGDRPLALRAAGEAAELSRVRRDRAGLAEALELDAALAADIAVATARLQEARSIWRDLGAVAAEARVEAAQAALAAGTSPASDDAETSPTDALEIRTLGGFEIVRGGVTLPVNAWGSRRARDLVKILVARRGHRVPRDQLMEWLWPDDDPVRTARRLSVMLSTARAVLDPERKAVPVGWIGADRDAVWLAVPPEAVDLERYHAAAAGGLAGLERDPAAARRALEAAESAYRGDFLEDDPYADWAVSVREEARTTYVRVGHAVARLAVERRDHETAVRHLRRVLEREPFDEPAHLALAASLGAVGRPADARRAYRRYVARMEELGVEAAPFPNPPARDRQ